MSVTFPGSQDSRVVWPPANGPVWDGEWLYPTGTPDFSASSIGAWSEDSEGVFSGSFVDAAGSGYTDPRGASYLCWRAKDLLGNDLSYPALILPRIQVLTPPAAGSNLQLGVGIGKESDPTAATQVRWVGLDYSSTDTRALAGGESGANYSSGESATADGTQMHMLLYGWGADGVARVSLDRIAADLMTGNSGSPTTAHRAQQTTSVGMFDEAWIFLFASASGAIASAQSVQVKVGYQALKPGSL